MTWPRLPSHVLLAEVDGRVIAVDTRSARSVTANPTLGFVLSHRDEFEDRNEAVHQLAWAMNTEPSVVERDLDRIERELDTLFPAQPPRPTSLLNSLEMAPQVVAPTQSTSLHVAALGAVVEVRMSSEVRDHVVTLLSPMATGATATASLDFWRRRDGQFALMLGDRLVCADADLAFVLSNLVSTITALAMEADSTGLLIHAASATIAGRAVVLAGSSGNGKSTLVTELVRRGAVYHTDELIEVDSRAGTIRSLCRPIGLDSGSHYLFPELAPIGWDHTQYQRWLLNPRSFGRTAPNGSRILLIVLSFDPTASGPTLTRLAGTDGVMELISNVVGLWRMTPDQLDGLVQLVRLNGVWKLTHAGGTAAADEIERFASCPT